MPLFVVLVKAQDEIQSKPQQQHLANDEVLHHANMSVPVNVGV